MSRPKGSRPAPRKAGPAKAPPAKAAPAKAAPAKAAAAKAGPAVDPVPTAPGRLVWLDWAGILVLCASAALAALLELLLVPLYHGSALVPIAVLFAVIGNVALPRLARGLVDRTSVALMPFAVWLLVVIVIGLFPRPEGDVILPGGGGGLQWVSYGVLLGGAVAGTLGVATSGSRLWPRPVSR